MLTMTKDEVSADAKVAFGRALREARTVKGVTQDDLAEALGLKQPTVAAWEQGISAPNTVAITFAVERALRARPGSLSRHLGYLPPEAVKSVATVESSILEDPALSPAEREMLLGAYRAAVATKRRKPGRPSKG